MSLKNIRYELSKDQLKKRKLLAETLAKEKEVEKFLKVNECPWEVYEENVSKFKRWLKGKRLAQSYSESDIIEDKSRGQYLDLVYDEKHQVVYEVVRKLPLVYELEKKQEYLKHYEVFPLSKSLERAFFEELDLESENPAYLKVAKTMIEFTDDDKLGYYLYGGLGVGKTYLSACVTNNYAQKGKRVALIHVPSFLNHLKQQFSSIGGIEHDLKRLRQVDLLVLDDLGAEPVTPWSRDEILLSILNERLENRRKTIITSNYKPDMLEDLYRVDTRGISDEIRSKRLVDRILALTLPVEVIGENRRHKQ